MAAFYLIIGFMFVGNLGWWLWADRRLRPLPAAVVWRGMLGLFIGLQVAYLAFFFAAPALARRAHYFVPQESLSVFYLWCLIVLPVTLLLTLLVKVPGLARRVVRVVRRDPPPAVFADIIQTPAVPQQGAAERLGVAGTSGTDSPRLSRRQLLSAAAVAVPPLVVGAGVMYGRHSIYDLWVRRVNVPVPGLPPDLDGLTIAHLTDVHVGKFVDEKYLRHVREMTNALDADLHLLTGDLIDLAISDLPGALDFVTSLDPKYGLLMCEGNHDLIEDGKAFYAGVRQKRIPLLVDGGQQVRVPGRSTPLKVLGMKWGAHGAGSPSETGFAKSVQQLTLQKSPDAFSILLAHHPHAFDAAAAAGIPLTLAGHTHGGLLMMSERVGPAALLYRYWSGLYQKDRSHLYVSNGVGSWYPLRLNARPEIAHLTLRSA